MGYARYKAREQKKKKTKLAFERVTNTSQGKGFQLSEQVTGSKTPMPGSRRRIVSHVDEPEIGEISADAKTLSDV
jgi:hypothetical protein